MTKEQQIKNYITNRFNNMTYDEYETICYGTGTLGVCDEAIAKYDADCELSDAEINELAKYCCDEDDKFARRYAMYQLSQELEDTQCINYRKNSKMRLQVHSSTRTESVD